MGMFFLIKYYSWLFTRRHLSTKKSLSSLIQEWHKEKATQQMVKDEIRKILGRTLPEKPYGREAFVEKVDLTFQHFYELAELGRGFAA